jgi:hypothetical protein
MSLQKSTETILTLRKSVTLCFILFLYLVQLNGQGAGVQFTSTDSALNRSFKWAKKQALAYKKNPADPVGPWYEAALPGRDAFCMRDASHQSIGAAILGMHIENRNMFTKIAENISPSRFWCSYWEINKDNKPAPADYRNDNDFWYNLNASFDVMNACLRLYNWTADRYYISDKVLLNFHEKSVTEYISSWKLQPDSLLRRPPGINVDTAQLKSFRRGFGLPSYAENVQGLAMSTDLLAALYKGFHSYAEILKLNKRESESVFYFDQAEKYREQLDKFWWDPRAKQYNTYFTRNGAFGKGEGEAYLLWFGILKDTMKINRTVKNLVSRQWNVENTSYFPALFYRYGFWKEAYKYLLFCSDPSTKRREYPEVSFAVIEGIVCGLMGVETDPAKRIVTTLHRTDNKELVNEIQKLQVLNTYIRVKHEGSSRTTFENTGNQAVIWKAVFSGKYTRAFRGKERIPVRTEAGKGGEILTYVEVPVLSGREVVITVR